MSCKYHDWVIVGEDEKSIGERCKLCGQNESYRKSDGRIDNVRYLKNHVRDFVQPEYKSLYIEIWGEKAYENSMKRRRDKEAEEGAIERGIKEGMENVKDSLKHWSHLESRGFTRQEILKAIDLI